MLVILHTFDVVDQRLFSTKVREYINFTKLFLFNRYFQHYKESKWPQFVQLFDSSNVFSNLYNLCRLCLISVLLKRFY